MKRRNSARNRDRSAALIKRRATARRDPLRITALRAAEVAEDFPRPAATAGAAVQVGMPRLEGITAEVVGIPRMEAIPADLETGVNG
jgi:hypothetical protein